MSDNPSSDPKFTPGPWTILGHEDDSGKWSSLEVAMEQMPFMRVCFMTSDGPNMENARLIAEAPAMYDLLAKVAAGYEISMADAATVIRRVRG